MEKYRQAAIPEAYTKEWTGLSVLATRKKLFEYYQAHYVNGSRVINQHLGIAVEFDRIGLKKASYGGSMYPKKACLVEVLDKLIRYAAYSNWGERKSSDNPHVIGYLNFKVAVRIDGKLEHIHLVVRVSNKGKFHYSMEVNVWA
jgi:hypothetical protein